MAKYDDLDREMREFEKNGTYTPKNIDEEMARFEASSEPAAVNDKFDPSNPQANVDYFARDKELLKQYNVNRRNLGKNLSVLAKPVSIVASPALEAIRTLPKHIAENVGENTSETPPIDYNAERKSGIYPSDRATTTNLIKDVINSLGIKSQPIASISSKEDPETAAEMEGLLNPYNLAGIALDVGLGKMVPEVKPIVTDKFKMAKAFIESKSTNRELLQKLKDSGKLNDVAAMMAEDPETYIRPFSSAKTLDYLQGPEELTKSFTGEVSGKRLKNQGKIAQLVEEQNVAVENMPRDTYDIDKMEIIDNAKAALRETLSKHIDHEASKNKTFNKYSEADIKRMKAAGAAVPEQESYPLIDAPSYVNRISSKGLLPTQITAAEKLIEQIVNATHPDKQKISMIRDVQNSGMEVKRLAAQIADESLRQIDGLNAEKVGVMENPPIATGSGGMPMKVAVSEARLSEINQNISDIKSGKAPAGKNFSNLAKLIKEKAQLEEFIKNSDPITEDAYRDMISKRNLEPAGYASTIRRQGNKLMDTQGLEPISEMGAANAAGMALESAGEIAQNTVMESGHMNDKFLFDMRNKDISTKINLADLLKKERITDQNKLSIPIGSGLRGFAREGLNLSDEYLRPYASKINQSGINKGVAYMNAARNPLAITLASFEIPRESSAIVNNKDAVLAKLAQEVKTPQEEHYFIMVKDVLENQPYRIKEMLPAMVMYFPHLFAQDKYNRIDWKVDPSMLQKAQQDLKLNKELSPSDKALKMDDLINKGELHD